MRRRRHGSRDRQGGDAAADIGFKQAAALRSPDVVSLEADVASAALEEASRLATIAVDLGFAPADAPRSPDVTSLEVDAASAALAALKLQTAAASQASEPSIAAAPTWIADPRQAAAPILEGLAAVVDRWLAASETASATPAPDETREAATADPADLTLRGSI